MSDGGRGVGIVHKGTATPTRALLLHSPSSSAISFSSLFVELEVSFAMEARSRSTSESTSHFTGDDFSAISSNVGDFISFSPKPMKRESSNELGADKVNFSL
jgi:hypothetical protein